MPINLEAGSLSSLDDVSAAEIRFLLRLAAELNSAKPSGSEQQRLKGRNIAPIFEKDRTRTRTGFEVAVYDRDALATCLGPSGSGSATSNR
jgi:ornithine carbamoyltransferase